MGGEQEVVGSNRRYGSSARARTKKPQPAAVPESWSARARARGAVSDYNNIAGARREPLPALLGASRESSSRAESPT